MMNIPDKIKALMAHTLLLPTAALAVSSDDWLHFGIRANWPANIPVREVAQWAVEPYGYEFVVSDRAPIIIFNSKPLLRNDATSTYTVGELLLRLVPDNISLVVDDEKKLITYETLSRP